jgi:RHS repeat-associated protein
LPDSTATPLTDATQLAQSLVWRGHRIDPTGFYYLGARYYEPTSGRFLSCDSLGFAAGTDLYTFCNGDCVNSFDPDGRCSDGSSNGQEFLDGGEGPGSYTNLSNNDPTNGQHYFEKDGQIWIQNPDGSVSPFYVDVTPDGPNGVHRNGGGGGGIYGINRPMSPLLAGLKIRGGPGYSHFDVGGPQSDMTPEQVDKVNALIDQLSNLRNPGTGHLTQAALLVRALERSGLAPLVTIEGKFIGLPVSHGYTGADFTDGKPNGAANITFESPDGADALAVLAHEIGNATSIVLNQGNMVPDIENESLRLGNEVKESTGYGGLISDTVNKGFVPGWNAYIPWVTTAPQHY